MLVSTSAIEGGGGGKHHFGKSFMHEAKMANGYKYRLRLIFLQTKEKLNANFFQKCMARAGYSRV